MQFIVMQIYLKYLFLQCIYDANIFLKELLVLSVLICIFRRFFLVKCLIMMQIYKSLLVKCQSMMQMYFKVGWLSATR